jgi:hypothetical protein
VVSADRRHRDVGYREQHEQGDSEEGQSFRIVAPIEVRAMDQDLFSRSVAGGRWEGSVPGRREQAGFLWNGKG